MKAYVIKCVDSKSKDFGKYYNGYGGYVSLESACCYIGTNFFLRKTEVCVPVEVTTAVTVREIKEDVK